MKVCVLCGHDVKCALTKIKCCESTIGVRLCYRCKRGSEELFAEKPGLKITVHHLAMANQDGYTLINERK